MSLLIKKIIFPNFPEFPELPVVPDIVNNLTSEDSGKTLSANMGRVLKESIPSVVDSLESEDVSKSLSAKQGSVLKGLIDNLPQLPVVPVIKAGYDNQTPPDFGLFQAYYLSNFIPYGYKRHVAFDGDFAAIPQVTLAQGISDKIYIDNITVSGFDLVAYSIELVGEFGNQQAYVNEPITWLAIGT